MKSDFAAASLFLVLGFPTWALVDGTWSALSQLAKHLPEEYKISSFLMISLTLGNTITIMCGSFFLRKTTYRGLHSIISIILALGFCSGLGLAFFWDKSVSWGDARVSLPLYVCFFVASSCATMSNVTHMTFVSHWSAANTTWLATGLGLGSMCSGFLSLLQGLLESRGIQSFSVQTYYLLLTMLYIPAFYALWTLRIAPSYASISINDGNCLLPVSAEAVRMGDECSVLLSSTVDSVLIAGVESKAVESAESDMVYVPTDAEFVYRYYPYLSFQLLNAMMGFGLVPSIISYVSGKFDNGYLVLLLATSISAVADPLFRAITIYVRITTLTGFCMSVGTLISLSLIVFSFLWLPGNSSIFNGYAGITISIAYPVINAINVFTNTCIFLHFKRNMDEAHMQQCYRIGGVATQCGSVIGTLFAFVLILSKAV